MSLDQETSRLLQRAVFNPDKGNWQGAPTLAIISYSDLALLDEPCRTGDILFAYSPGTTVYTVHDTNLLELHGLLIKLRSNKANSYVKSPLYRPFVLGLDVGPLFMLDEPWYSGRTNELRHVVNRVAHMLYPYRCLAIVDDEGIYDRESSQRKFLINMVIPVGWCTNCTGSGTTVHSPLGLCPACWGSGFLPPAVLVSLVLAVAPRIKEEGLELARTLAGEHYGATC